MIKKSILTGIAGVIFAAVAMIFYVFPQMYLYTENSNFEKLKKKSVLDCTTMPLHCLVKDGYEGGVADYIRRGGGLELKDGWGQSALLWAVRNDRVTSVPLLLEAGADPNTADENGMSVLYHAMLLEKYDVADALLFHGGDINRLNGNEYPETVLHFCVMKNRLECVRYLLGNGASKSIKDAFGYTVIERVKLHEHISKDVAEALRG